MHPDLIVLLQRLADRRRATSSARFGSGANAVTPDQHHLTHADGETIALLRELGERAAELVPAAAQAAP